MTQFLLDVTRLVKRFHKGLIPTGVDRVGLAYIERYGERARGILSEQGFSAIMSDRDSQRIFSLLLSAKQDPGLLRTLVARTLLRSLASPESECATLLHTSHNGMEFPRYYRAMTKRNVRTVFMVHDLIPLTHAEYCRPGVDEAHRKRIRTALRHASGLIANSQGTLDALVHEAQLADLPLPPSVVAHLAPAPTHRITSTPAPREPYFVMLGTIEPRKNHWFMLHVWRRLVELHGDAAPKLVIVGRRGWECENVVDMLERCAELRGFVVEEPDCSDERLSALLQRARALLFPSFAEGYGLPLVEALGLNVPVLASDIAIFREVADDIPDYLDPLDGPGWQARIMSYATSDSPERSAQLLRIPRFRVPTWCDHFDRVDAFLATLTER
ncbi:glycosyltransferase family 4 protein [Burkholderia contaminans]|uniref:glycosyltransferase family 4 protein n=1 Tax=Burkholderia contaminans TaxID=488447 RepID=UPI003D67358C